MKYVFVHIAIQSSNFIPKSIENSIKIYNIRCKIDLIFGVVRHFQQYFIYIMETSFSVGRGRSTRREPETMGK